MPNPGKNKLTENRVPQLTNIAALVISLVCLTACSPSEDKNKTESENPSEWPRSIVDSLDRTITVDSPPQRIIPIFASNTELLHALGLRSKMVAREEMARYPADILELPIVGGKTGFSVEAILSKKPDLVVLTPARQAAGNLAEPLTRMGIPTVVLQHPTVESIFRNLLLLGHLNGRDEQAAALASEWRLRLDQLTAQIKDQPTVTVFLETGSIHGGIVASVQPESYTWNMVELSGGTFPWSHFEGPGQVSWESILRADPDIYLVARNDAWQEEAKSRPGWSHLKAVRNGNVHSVERAHLLIPGPRVIDGIQEMIAIFHPSGSSNLPHPLAEEP